MASGQCVQSVQSWFASGRALRERDGMGVYSIFIDIIRLMTIVAAVTREEEQE